MRRRMTNAETGYVDLPPRDAAERLGMSVQALWAFLRRHEDEHGNVELGGEISAYRMGARAWRVRFPLGTAGSGRRVVSWMRRT